MFAGVICACIPSVAYAARQQNSMFQKLANSISKSRSARSGNEYSSRSKPEELEAGGEAAALKSTDRKYAQYFNLDELATTGSTINDDKRSSRTLDGPFGVGTTTTCTVQGGVDRDVERQ